MAFGSSISTRPDFIVWGGRINEADDTYAWDANLYTKENRNADLGVAVYAVADGEVVKYGGAVPPGAHMAPCSLLIH